MDPAELQSYYPLLEAAIENRLTPQEHAQLEQALSVSPRLREMYLEAVGVHIDLDQLSQQDEVSSAADPLPSPSLQQFWNRASKVLVFCATTTLIVLLIWRQTTLPATSSGLTTAELPASPHATPVTHPAEPTDNPLIDEVANTKLFGEGLAPTPGQKLQLNKEYILSQGFLAIRFHQGAKAVLQAPCVFHIRGPASLQLHSGQCSVHAPPGAEGFQILSPSAEVIDLGTRFVIAVGEMGETELSVVEGQASLRAAHDQSEQTLLLNQGESARVDPGQIPHRLTSPEQPLVFRENLPDRVIRFAASKNSAGLANDLLSIEVQRAGQIINYSQEQLIRSRLKHFEITADKAAFCTRMGEELPAGEDRLGLLDTDWSLATGVINPLLTEPRTPISEMRPVMVIQFAEPVVNGPGPDIVLFDLQVMVSHPTGDTVRMRSGDDRAQRPIIEQNQFDIDLTSPFALDLVPHKTYRCSETTYTLQDLITHDFQHGHQVHVNAKAIALGIDLTDLGYATGEALETLEFLPVFDRNVFDPVLIVGLPGSVDPPAVHRDQPE